MPRDAREPLPDDVATLLERERELQALSKEVAIRERDLKAMEDRIATRKRDLQTLAVKTDLQSQTIAEQARRQEQLEHRLGQLLKQLYGRKSERFFDPDQLLLSDEDDLKARQQEQREAKLAERQAKKPDAKPKRPGYGRRGLPDHLPWEVVRHEIPQSQRACPGCGQERVEIGCESSEQLEYVPASFKVLVHERVKYACRGCQEHVAIAAPAPNLSKRVCQGQAFWPTRPWPNTATTCRCTGWRTSPPAAGSSCVAAPCATGSPAPPNLLSRCTGK